MNHASLGAGPARAGTLGTLGIQGTLGTLGIQGTLGTLGTLGTPGMLDPIGPAFENFRRTYCPPPRSRNRLSLSELQEKA